MGHKILFFGEVKACDCGTGFAAKISGEIAGEEFDVSGNGKTHAEAINTALLAISFQRS